MQVAHRLAPLVNRALKPLDLQISRWSRSTNARRVRILEHLDLETLLDIGANEGQYARILRGAGFTGTIVSCEPIAAVFRTLEKACATDNRWTAHRLAIGAEGGEAEIHVSASSVFSSLLPIKDETVAFHSPAAPTRSEKVPMMTLDAFADRVAPSGPIGIKIDVQGFEDSVLRSGPVALQRARFVELELSPEPIYRGETPMLGILAQLDKHGFILAGVENEWADAETGRALQINGIFVRRD